MKKWDKIIYIFFLLLPIIDLCTSLTTKFTSVSITPGMIVKGITLIICLLYVSFFSKSKYKKETIIYLSLLIFFGVIYFLSKNYVLSIAKIANELKYAFKYFYFPVMICGMLNMIDDYKPSKDLIIKILISNAIIYTILMIVPYITSTSFNSYTEYWLYSGESGWFFSANEVGAILTLLLICVYYFINYRQKWYIILVLPLMISIAIIGTKVSFIGLIIMTFLCLIFMLINKKRKIIPCIIVSLFLLVSLFFSPTFNNFINLKTNTDKNISEIDKTEDTNIDKNISETDKNEETNIDKNISEIEQTEEIVENNGGSNSTANVINKLEDLIPIRFVANNLRVLLSNRDTFLINNLNIYINSNLEDKLFGLGWNDRPELNYTISKKMIEIDVADIFIHYGIIGFLIYFLPLLYCFALEIKNIKYFTIETWLSFMTFMVEIGISLFAGHVLSAPTVSIYLVLLIALTMITIYEKKETK